MANISVSLYSDHRAGTTSMYVECRGVASGVYQDLWSFRRRFNSMPSSSAAALRMIQQALEDILAGPTPSDCDGGS